MTLFSDEAKCICFKSYCRRIRSPDEYALKTFAKKVAKKVGVPPFVVFQDPSLEDRVLKYPISLHELN
jgi:hypothetical protein